MTQPSKFCGQCGSPVEAGARFCGSCGASTDAVAGASTAAPPPLAPVSYPPQLRPTPSGPPAPPPARGQRSLVARVAGPVGAALLTIAIGAAIAFFTLGGGGGNAFDPKRADELAHAALLTAADLPGSDWSVTKEDDFADTTPWTDRCVALIGKALKGGAIDGTESGRANRTLTRPGADADTDITSTVEVYPSTGGLDAAVKGVKATAEGKDFAPCVEEAFLQDQASDSTTFKVTSVGALTSAPHGGFGVGYDLTLTTAGTTIVVALQEYEWRYGNAIVQVNATGAKADLTAALLAQAVAKADTAAQNAGKLKPGASPVAQTATPSGAKTATAAPKSPTATPRTATPSAALTFDPKRADELAHLALISDYDLPSGDWSIYEGDDFAHSSEDWPADCRAIGSLLDTAGAAIASDAAGRAQVYLSDSAGEFDLDVEQEVFIYAAGTNLDKALADIRAATTDAKLQGCFERAVAPDVPAGASATIALTAGDIQPPSGGVTLTVEIVLNNPIAGEKYTLHHDYIVWRVGNALVSVQITSTPEQATLAFGNQVVSVVDAAVRAAAKQ